MNAVAVRLLGKGTGWDSKSLKACETRRQAQNTSVLPRIAATWSRSVVDERAASCHCDNRGKVPPSMEDACPDVAHQSSAVLLCANAEPSVGLLALACVDGGLGVSDTVRGICLADSE